MSDHDYCNKTDYCRVCGQHRDYASYHGVVCIGNKTNVLAMSHRRFAEINTERRRKIEQWLAQKSVDSTTKD